VWLSVASRADGYLRILFLHQHVVVAAGSSRALHRLIEGGAALDHGNAMDKTKTGARCSNG